MSRIRTEHSQLPLNIPKFTTGLATNRDPLHPVIVNGQPMADALIDGSNVEISNNDTLIRRPGFPVYCSPVIPSGTPLGFTSFNVPNVGVKKYLDTTTNVYLFTTSAITNVYTKGTTAQSRFVQVGSNFFWVDGTDAKLLRYPSGVETVTKWGITAPTAAPAVANVDASSLPSWAANTFYWPTPLIVDSNNNIQLLTTAGTTGGAEPVWSSTPGVTTADNTAVWTCEGTKTRATAHVYTANSYIQVDYTKTVVARIWNSKKKAYVNTNVSINYSDFFVTFLGGTSSATATGSISWVSGVGSVVKDGTVTWTNAGVKVVWADPGAACLVSTDTYVVDSDGNQQDVIDSGQSSATVPTFSGQLNGMTVDNEITWSNSGQVSSANPLPWTYIAVYKNSSTGHISCGSPASPSIFQGAAKNIAVSGDGSADTQVDFVDIYRTKQGGGIYYYVDSVANGGSGTTWNYTDSKSDQNLNEQLIVTTVPINLPPPAGSSLCAFWQGRVWLASGNLVYFDAGGDCTNGDPHQSFPLANVFTYPTTVTALIPTNEGLVIGLNDETFVILGGPGTTTFYTIPLFKRTGIKSQNAVQQDQDRVYLLSSQSQGLTFSSADFDEFGSNVGDKLLSTFPPATSHLALHRNGPDVGIFISDASANIIRFNPSTGAWSPVAQPVGGCGPIASLETSSGVYTLLTTIGGYICGRSLTSFLDGNGASTYAAYGTVGSLDIAGMAGPTAAIRSLFMRTTSAGTKPTVSILQNSTSGSFTAVSRTCTVPAMLSSTSLESSTVRQDRYDIGGDTTVALSEFNHLQVKITFATENQKNELTGMALGGDQR
jgi:hypothetical protein